MSYFEDVDTETAQQAPYNKFFFLSDHQETAAQANLANYDRDVRSIPLSWAKTTSSANERDSSIWRLDPVKDRPGQFFIVNRLKGLPLAIDGGRGFALKKRFASIADGYDHVLIFEISHDARNARIEDLRQKLRQNDEAYAAARQRIEKAIAEYRRTNPEADLPDPAPSDRAWLQELEDLEAEKTDLTRDLSALLRRSDNQVHLKVVNAKLDSDGYVKHANHTPDPEDTSLSQTCYMGVIKDGFIAVGEADLSDTDLVSMIRATPTQPEGARYTLSEEDAETADDGAAMALDIVQSVAGLAATMVGAWSGFGKSKSLIKRGVPAVANLFAGVGGISDVTGIVLDFIGLGEPEEDPLDKLYAKMMPEIERLIREGAIEDNVTDASGMLRAASMAYRSATIAIAGITRDLLGEPETQTETDRTRAVYDALDPLERDRLTHLLGIADGGYRNGLAHLMIDKNAKAGLAVFMPAAAEHITVMLLLSGLYPNIDGRALRATIQTYAAHAENTYRAMEQDRLGHLKARDDGYYGPIRHVIDEQIYRDLHIPRMLEIDLGNPQAFASAWRSLAV